MMKRHDDRPGLGSLRYALLVSVAAASMGACSDSTPEGDTSVPSGNSGAGTEQSNPKGTVWFEEVAAESGLNFTHTSGASGNFYMPEITTTGAALFDADGDGDLDAYLAQGGAVEQERSARPGNQLFENVGGGAFKDVSAGSGTEDQGYAMAVATGDFDGDGDVDLFVSNLERNTLLRNDGDMKFVDVTEAAGLADSNAWSASAAFFDMEGDGDLDLFVSNYIEWGKDSEITCRSPRNTQTYCSPKSYGRPAKDQLFENNGDGSFTDISDASGVSSAKGNGLGVVCSDFDLDGSPEIFVANDGTPNHLWDRTGANTFENKGTILGCAVDLQGRAKAGMGVATADIDHDGDEDLLVVNLTGEDDSFYRNDNGSFVDKTPTVGLAAVSRKRTRFGVALRDFDLDGRFDLYQANGRVTEPAQLKKGDPFAEENVVLRGNEKGRFKEVMPRGGVKAPLVATSRAAAFGDVDGDGDIDILVHNKDGAVHLLRNVAPRGGDAVMIDVLNANGAPAIGAVVIAHQAGKKTRYEVRTADSYGAASSPRIHIGASAQTPVERVEVTFPDGRTMQAEGLAAGEVQTFK